MYKIHNRDGTEIGGDANLDDVTKAAALLAMGYITDMDGVVVYESEPYKEYKANQ